MKIWVVGVDDEAIIRASIKDLLGQVGIEIRMFGTAHEVKTHARREVIDVLLVDHDLKDHENGFDLIRYVKGIHRDCVFCLMTSSESPDVFIDFFEKNSGTAAIRKGTVNFREELLDKVNMCVLTAENKKKRKALRDGLRSD